jgi:hypothetical protein
LTAYSHRTRELLILGCTEVENSWKHYMRLAATASVAGRDFTTRDYVKLLQPLFLSEFEVTLKPYRGVAPLRPFLDWDPASPTRSLLWYDAYNKTKHDRTTYFAEATLQSCFAAVAANIVLFCVRFGPFALFSSGTLGTLIPHLFNIELMDCDPTTFYIPQLSLPSNWRSDLICVQSKERVQKWSTLPLRL